MTFTKTSKAFLVLCALTLAACTSDQITASLEGAVDAAIAAATIAAPRDVPYLTLAQGCMDSAVSILSSTSAPALKATQIAASCADAVAQGRTGSPAVQAVSAALDAFLNTVQGLSAQLQFSNPAAVNAFVDGTPAKVSKAGLKKVNAKLAKLKAALKK